jgi:hypothetical protein
MRRNVRSKCCALLIAALIGSFVVAGCATKHQGRWIEPQAVFGFSSIEEITNKFASYQVVATQGMRTREVRTTKGAHFLFLTTIPYSSSNILTTYCFEQTEPDFWNLRALLLFARVRTVDLDFVVDGDNVNVVHEGKVLFKAASAVSDRQQSP